MAAIFIESDNIKSLKLLTELAEQLGVTVNKLSKPETENLHLVRHVKKEKNSKQVSNIANDNGNISVPAANGNYFSNLRRRVKNKMTNDQIDQQIKSLRMEWQRDI